MRTPSSWKESLSKLIEGNQRFRSGLRSVESFASSLRLRELAENGQNPSAIILTCSDSRVPTEILFDKGVGDLFVIRVAGNVISRSIVASIEYAATVLQTPLCVVMGHTHCGAVRSAYQTVQNKTLETTVNLERLLEKITPAIEETLKNFPEANEESVLRMSGVLNVQRQVNLIQKNSRVLKTLCQQDKFKIIGALYNLHDGDISFDIDGGAYGKVENTIPEVIRNPIHFPMKSSELL